MAVEVRTVGAHALTPIRAHALTPIRAHAALTAWLVESRVSLDRLNFAREMWFIFAQTITVHCMGIRNTEVYLYTIGGPNEQSWVPTKEVKLLQNNPRRVKSHSPRANS